jgi:hypothetical protein
MLPLPRIAKRFTLTVDHASRVTIEVATRADIDLAAVRRVARRGEPMRLAPVTLRHLDSDEPPAATS